MLGTLDDIRGCQAGQSAVVMGSGPSLRHIDKRVHRHVTIAVNSAIMKIPDSDYYISSDPGALKVKHWKYVEASGCKVVVTAAFICENPSVGYSHLKGVSNERVIVYDKGSQIGMGKNAKSLIFGISSAHCAVHLAVVMGCSPIYLIGNDCMYEDGKKWFWQFPKQGPSDGMEDGEPVWTWWQRIHGRSVQPGEHGAGWDGKNGDGYLGATITYWIQMAKHNRGIDIRNASGGRLGGIFPQVTIEELLGV